MITDDELVLLYLEIGNLLINKNPEDNFKFIQSIEKNYEFVADTELGDFLNSIGLLYYNQLQDDELHSYIRDVIYDYDLNYEMLFSVGSDILTSLYTKAY
jgi:hypothetical protein